MYRVSNDDPHKPNETKSFLPRLLANTCVSDFFRLALLYARDRQVHVICNLNGKISGCVLKKISKIFSQ